MAKIMQSVYLCYIFPLEHKKITISRGLTWFLILGKIQDGDYCWWRHRPPAAPLPIKYISSCREDQRLSTKGGKKHIKNPSGGGGGGSIHPFLYHGGGMNLHLRQRVKSPLENLHLVWNHLLASEAEKCLLDRNVCNPWIQTTVKLPSLHDRRYRLEVYANRFCHLRPPAWLRKFVMFYCAAR